MNHGQNHSHNARFSINYGSGTPDAIRHGSWPDRAAGTDESHDTPIGRDSWVGRRRCVDDHLGCQSDQRPSPRTTTRRYAVTPTCHAGRTHRSWSITNLEGGMYVTDFPCAARRLPATGYVVGGGDDTEGRQHEYGGQDQKRHQYMSLESKSPRRRGTGDSGIALGLFTWLRPSP